MSRTSPEKTGAKEGERIAKRMARAGLCSRREAESWIAQGRVKVNGKVIVSAALNVTDKDKIDIDGKVLGTAAAPHVWRFHKPKGTITSNKDPQGRTTIFDVLPKGLPRVVTIGRLDYNTEGLLLLTNDGALARHLELPATGWKRKYRVRVFGKVDQAQLDSLKKGITVDGVRYNNIEAKIEKQQGDNLWLAITLTEGKNREIRRVCEALGLSVNRLIRVSYGPFLLGDLPKGAVEEIPRKALKESLGKFLE